MTAEKLKNLWQRVRVEAEQVAQTEKALSLLIERVILNAHSLGDALAYRLSEKLADTDISNNEWLHIFRGLLAADPRIEKAAGRDLEAVWQRDPAARGFLSPILYFKGYLALQGARFAHALWHSDRRLLALHLQSRMSEIFQVDIHPAARFGSGIMLDHATSFVAGETAVVGNDVSILHEVTLGGTGKVTGDRHPKVGDKVLIGVGAKLLGNIKIGVGARIGANSVVLQDVAPHTTVAGVPAKVLRASATPDDAALSMDHQI